jgi:hypothetical protein
MRAMNEISRAGLLVGRRRKQGYTNAGISDAARILFRFRRLR